MTILLVLSLLVLTIYGIERNHRRDAGRRGGLAGSRGGLAGSSNVEDRDTARTYAELHALTDRRPVHHARRALGLPRLRTP
ncbi:MAG: hypothetical protein ACRDT6_11010 [Micromonosporaceae bacterium]